LRDEKWIRYFWLENLKRRDHSEDIGVGGRIIGSCGLDSSGSEYGPSVGSRERGDELSGSIKGEEFIDWMSDF
jgi:hypothetical protein